MPPDVTTAARHLQAHLPRVAPAQVLEAGGVAPLVRLLKNRDDKKVTLHATAAVQNLTYKNTACCQSVLEHGGEKALKKLLHHKSEDVQQVPPSRMARARQRARIGRARARAYS